MTSRREEKDKRRQERLEWEREQQEQTKRRRLYSIVAGGILVVAAAAAIIIAVAAGGGDDTKTADSQGGTKLELTASKPPDQKSADLFAAAKAADCTLTNPAIEGRTHLDPNAKVPDYGTNPPNSGNHDPVPAVDGAYSNAPGIKHLVHSLEHGRIEVHHRGISQKQLAQLKGLYDEDPYHMFLVPNETKMKGEVAVAAWGHVATCKKMTPETFDLIRAFTTRYRDKGPEFVP